MSEHIYIFNPEHDLCVANGDENFVPPRSAVGFAKENIVLSGHMKRLNKQRRQIIPWGWNHSLRKRLIKEGIDPASLPSEEELQFIRTHSRREFALDVHSRLSYVDPQVIGKRDPESVSLHRGSGHTAPRTSHKALSLPGQSLEGSDHPGGSW